MNSAKVYIFIFYCNTSKLAAYLTYDANQINYPIKNLPNLVFNIKFDNSIDNTIASRNPTHGSK